MQVILNDCIIYAITEYSVIFIILDVSKRNKSNESCVAHQIADAHIVAFGWEYLTQLLELAATLF